MSLILSGHLSSQGTSGPDPSTVYVDMKSLRHDRLAEPSAVGHVIQPTENILRDGFLFPQGEAGGARGAAESSTHGVGHREY